MTTRLKRSRIPCWRLGCLLLLLVFVFTRVWFEHVRALEQRVNACAIFVGDALITQVETPDMGAPYVQVTVETVPGNVRAASRAVSGTQECDISSHTRLRLVWPVEIAQPASGEVWSLNAKVRPPHGFANPGGFDYERWLLSERIGGSGLVLVAKPVRSAVSSGVGLFRQLVRDELTSGNYVYGPVLLALAIADTSRMGAATWETLRTTGTIHLLVVSGLHITVVAVMAAMPGLLIGRLLVLIRPEWPAAWSGALTGLAGATAYTVFTGVEVPALRSVIMLTAVTLFLLLVRRLGAWGVFVLVVWVVVVSAPLSILAQGFWLSFGAVAVLLLAHGFRFKAAGESSPIRVLLVTQVVLSIAMVPWQALTVGQVAVSGLWLNILVVPLLSGVAIPLLLAGCALLPVLPTIAGHCFGLADITTAVVMAVLERSGSGPPFLLADHSMSLLILALSGAMLLLLPLATRIRFLLIPVWALIFAPSWPRLPPGEFRLHVLDVGQGSAALVETRQQTWVFDTGPRFGADFDAGEAVVAPALASVSNRSLHKLIVTHSDLDHSGGMAALRRRYPDVLTIGSQGTHARLDCHTRPSFEEDDGIRFTFLTSPLVRKAVSSNDRSCALLVDNSEHAILLTGDSSATMEMSLLHAVPEASRRRVRVLLVPHHGSRSSSSLAWVRLLRPRFALVSAGRFNRYGHPHPVVVERYRRYGAQVITTGSGGRLLWSTLEPARTEKFRDSNWRYWMSPPST